MSLVACLHISGRIPIRTIQKFLSMVYGLHISTGELVEILHAVADAGVGKQEQLISQIRGSPYVNADETGWRQDGENGYVWSFSTPSVRYFVYNKSRSGQVAREVMGDDYLGVVGCDFYCGYNVLLCDRQRCWVHMLRDLRKLKEEYPEVVSWVEAVEAVYRQAKEFGSEDPQVRMRQRHVLEGELHRLAKRYADGDEPQRVLAQRIEKFLEELFMFVEYPEVPSENNSAERAIRPAVVARKISGGTRSDKGSATKMTLMSLFGTWAAQGVNPLETCRKMLVTSAPA